MFRIGCVLLMVIMLPAQAWELDVQVTGKVVIPPCTINDGRIITVDFKHVMINKINGNNYFITTTVPFDCYYKSNKPYVNIVGPVLPGAPSHILQANIAGSSSDNFGVAFYAGAQVDESKRLPIGTSTGAIAKEVITDGHEGAGTLTFTTVPWKKSGTTLATGEFSAAASLLIGYL